MRHPQGDLPDFLQFYAVFALIRTLLIVFLSVWAYGLMAQWAKPLRVHALVGAEYGLRTFRGDVLQTRFAESQPGFSLYGGAGWQRFDALLRFGKGQISAGNFRYPDPSNFHANLQSIDFSIRTALLRESDFNPFIQLGLGNAWFSSHTNLTDASGRTYFFWSDGSIRDLPESEYNQYLAQPLVLDNTYESPLAIKQRSIFIPVQAGIDFKMVRGVHMTVAMEFLLLQSDNMDRNTSNASWDRLRSLNFGLVWSPQPRKKESSPKVAPPVMAIGVPKAEFRAIMLEDEDQDGVPDSRDLCYGTPKGWPVNAEGCTADTDQDGVPDHLDAEVQSPPAAWVDAQGKSLSDDEIRKLHRDTAGMFVRILRKVHKGSRPYPIRKHIPEGNYKKYAKLAEAHPEWKQQVPLSPAQLPAEFQSLDMDRDGVLSMRELELCTHLMFEGLRPDLNPERIRLALKYAFENP